MFLLVFSYTFAITKIGHAQASQLEDDRHVELGQVPSAAAAEDSLDEQIVSQSQNTQVSPAKITRTTPSGLNTGEINSYCLPLRFCGCLLHSILVAIGNLYMIPVFCFVFKDFNLLEDTQQSQRILDNEQKQEKNWNQVKCGTWAEPETVKIQTLSGLQVLLWEGLLRNLTPAARLETGILGAPGEIGNMFLTK